jgi:hypothetical protein
MMQGLQLGKDAYIQLITATLCATQRDSLWMHVNARLQRDPALGSFTYIHGQVAVMHPGHR